MTRQYFGTDGIRGEVGKFPIVPDFVMRLGYAAGPLRNPSASQSQEQSETYRLPLEYHLYQNIDVSYMYFISNPG